MTNKIRRTCEGHPLEEAVVKVYKDYDLASMAYRIVARCKIYGKEFDYSSMVDDRHEAIIEKEVVRAYYAVLDGLVNSGFPYTTTRLEMMS